MRKRFLFFYILILMLLLPYARAESIKSISMQDFKMGDSLDSITSILDNNHIEYELYVDDYYHDAQIYTVFSIDSCTRECSLLFDDNMNLIEVFLSLNDHTLNQAYTLLSDELGKPDFIFHPDYIDYDIDSSSDLTCFCSCSITWIKDDAIYHLGLDNNINVQINCDIFHGIVIKPGKQYPSIGLSIYSLDQLEEITRRYN